MLVDFKRLLTQPKYVLFAGAILAAVLFITPVLIGSTSHPRFCDSCHEMNPAMRSWEKSSHSNVTCYSCHGAENIVSLMYHKILALNELRLHVTGAYETPLNIESHLADDSHEMGSTICKRCHNVTAREVTASEGIIIDHKVHDDKGIHCAKCHNRVAHKTAGEYLESSDKDYEDHMEMKYCMKCHTGDGKTDEANVGPRRCSACHPKGFELKPSNHNQANFFPAKHGKMANKDMDYCQSCHFEQKMCISCHKMEMPHPASGWTDKEKDKDHHSVKGKADPASCQLCHKQGADFCDSCHHNNNTGKPWINVHFEVVKKQGAAQPCFECHSALTCAHCHVRGGSE